MQKGTFKPHYAAFRKAHIVGNYLTEKQDYCELLRISESGVKILSRYDFLSDSVFGGDADLVCIDIDAVGTAEAHCLIMLCNSFNPGLPMVLTTRNTVDEDTRKKYLRRVGVIDLIQLGETAAVPCEVAA